MQTKVFHDFVIFLCVFMCIITTIDNAWVELKNPSNFLKQVHVDMNTVEPLYSGHHWDCS